MVLVKKPFQQRPCLKTDGQYFYLYWPRLTAFWALPLGNRRAVVP